MNKHSFKERFRYWFDNRMSGGTSSMIKMLTISTVFIVLIIASIISILHLEDEGTWFSAIWNGFATVINAWMPYADEGGVLYIILTAVVSIIGVLFTSILIGIISTIIEEKVTDLRKGNSKILETDHIVVLGFEDGEFELIHQLILAAEKENRCIVIAEKMEREDMENAIRSNLDIPKNVRIIFRNIDISDSVALDCCSIPDCRTVIINPLDDARTIKVILAVSSLIDNESLSSDTEPVTIVTAVHSDAYMLPASMLKEKHVIMLQTNDVIAKIIARSCIQPGLSDTFLEMFNFYGSEIYIVPSEHAAGFSFGQIVCNTNHAVPLGIIRNGETILNPSPDTIIAKSDKLISFSESRTSAPIHMDQNIWEPICMTPGIVEDYSCEHIVVLGFNETFDTIIRELPDKHIRISIAGTTEDQNAQAIGYASERDEIDVIPFEGDINQPDHFEKLIKDCGHIVLLSDHMLDEEEADIQTMLRLLQIRDIRHRFHKDFTITTEMQRDNNRKLVLSDSQIDFVVASNMSSMFIAQIAENPELHEIYAELLSNAGNDICLKEVGRFDYISDTEITIAELRKKALMQGYIVLGYLRYSADNYHIVLNPDYQKRIQLLEDDSLILIGMS